MAAVAAASQAPSVRCVTAAANMAGAEQEQAEMRSAADVAAAAKTASDGGAAGRRGDLVDRLIAGHVLNDNLPLLQRIRDRMDR